MCLRPTTDTRPLTERRVPLVCTRPKSRGSCRLLGRHFLDAIFAVPFEKYEKKARENMRIKSKWGRGIHEGKVVSIVDGKRIFIHLRSATETHALGNMATRLSQSVLAVSIDNVQKIADHMSEPFTHAKRDDVVVLLYASDETRRAALTVLGLCDA